jgi:hypothetical protein
MVPCFHVFSLGWLSIVAGCCASEAMRWQRGFSRQCSERVSGYRNVKRCGADGIRRMPATMKRCEYMLGERRNGAGERTVAVWGCVAAWQESPRNLSVFRPSPDRQMAVWGMAFNARRTGRVDAANRKACEPEPVAAGVSDGSERPPMRMQRRWENAARVECLAENTGIFEVLQEKGPARVECLAEKTRVLEAFEDDGAVRAECLVESGRRLWHDGRVWGAGQCALQSGEIHKCKKLDRVDLLAKRTGNLSL